jgi:hypothetical protein
MVLKYNRTIVICLSYHSVNPGLHVDIRDENIWLGLVCLYLVILGLFTVLIQETSFV